MHGYSDKWNAQLKEALKLIPGSWRLIVGYQNGGVYERGRLRVHFEYQSGGSVALNIICTDGLMPSLLDVRIIQEDFLEGRESILELPASEEWVESVTVHCLNED